MTAMKNRVKASLESVRAGIEEAGDELGRAAEEGFLFLEKSVRGGSKVATHATAAIGTATSHEAKPSHQPKPAPPFVPPRTDRFEPEVGDPEAFVPQVEEPVVPGVKVPDVQEPPPGKPDVYDPVARRPLVLVGPRASTAARDMPIALHPDQAAHAEPAWRPSAPAWHTVDPEQPSPEIAGEVDDSAMMEEDTTPYRVYPQADGSSRAASDIVELRPGEARSKRARAAE